MNSPRCGGLCGASSVHFGELCSAAASLQPGQSCEVGEVVRVGGDDALLVMGKRTRVLPGNQLRSACANGCEHLCRGRSSAGASNPGLLGAPVLPRAWGTCSSHAGRRGCVPSLPARERGREMGPFFPFPPPPKLPGAHHTDGDFAGLVLVSAAQKQVLAAPCVVRSCSFGSQLRWEGCPMLWPSSGSPQAQLRSATRGSTTEDGTDFAGYRYAYV